MKSKNKRSTLKFAILLSVVSLATVGFSAWIIDGSISSDNSQINFSVGEVVDNSIVVNIIDDKIDDKIAFDSIQDGASDKVQGNSASEDMTFAIEYTVTSGVPFETQNVTITYTYSSDFDGIKGLGTSNYIDASCLSVNTFNLDGTTTKPANGVAVSYSENVATVSHTWTFAWGSIFNGKNPCNVVNGDSGYDKLVENLKAFQTAASSAMSGKTFTITITPSFNE